MLLNTQLKGKKIQVHTKERKLSILKYDEQVNIPAFLHFQNHIA